MRIQPIICFPEIDKEAILSFECSDRFLFPKTYFEGLEFVPHTLVNIANVRKQQIIGAIFGIHEFDDTTIYVPTWLFSQMDVCENVFVGSMTKKKCSMIQVKPHNDAFRRNPEFLKLIQMGMSQYFSLTQNTRIPLKVDDRIEYVTIVLMFPEQNKTCFIYNSGGVSIQIMESLELEEAPPEYLYNTRTSAAHTLVPFPGAGRAVGCPSPTASAEVRMAAPAAAGAAARIRYRMAKMREYSLRRRAPASTPRSVPPVVAAATTETNPKEKTDMKS